MRSSDQPILVTDFENSPEVPANFRIANYNPSAKESRVTAVGLDALNASAARQFCELNLKNSLERMSGRIYIVDLRQESHAFIDGRPMCWYGLKNQANVGKTKQEIADIEEELISRIARQGEIELNDIVLKTNGRIVRTRSSRVDFQRCESERDLVERNGLKYVRLPVTDHRHPDDKTVAEFLDFLGSLTGDYWLHFHCRSGKGRTSTFLVLYDIFHNAKQVSLEDIICRNFLLGSKDLSKISDIPKKMWKNKMANRRFEFVSSFYQFMTESDEYRSDSWADWLRQRI